MSETNYKQKYAKYKKKYKLNISKQDGGASPYDGDMDRLMESFFAHQIQIKLYHFQTSKYGAHKTLDCYLCKFTSNLDRFMEVAQGFLDTRVSQENVRLDVPMLNAENVNGMLDQFKNNILNGVVESKFGTHKGLSAIRDEMVADLDQLKYLLTFD